MNNFKKSLPFILALFVLISISCQRGIVEAELIQFLDEKEAVYEEISIQVGTAYWNMYADKPEVDLESDKYRYLELFSDEELNSLIGEWYKKRDKIKTKRIQEE